MHYVLKFAAPISKCFRRLIQVVCIGSVLRCFLRDFRLVNFQTRGPEGPGSLTLEKGQKVTVDPISTTEPQFSNKGQLILNHLWTLLWMQFLCKTISKLNKWFRCCSNVVVVILALVAILLNRAELWKQFTKCVANVAICIRKSILLLICWVTLTTICFFVSRPIFPCNDML